MSEIFHEQLEALRARSLHRKLREIGTAQGAEVCASGKPLINFSSNDYLGLANDPILREAARNAIDEFGVGSGSSRLICGTQSPHVRLETALAKWKGTEAAICFSSGYAAAVGALSAIAGKQDVIILDKLCHASLIDGARMSGATLRVFPHNHLGKLESHLEWAHRERPNNVIIIVTESIYSMDGDRAPLREIAELKKRFEALLFVDEAHAVGILGPNGRGLLAELGVDADIQMGTLSKALGVSGGYICGSRTLIDWLINRARSFIFTTAPPPALAAAAIASLDFFCSDAGEKRRQLLWERIRLLRAKLCSLGISTPDRDGAMRAGSAIHPWIIGEEAAALERAQALERAGFLVPAIRYPTVAKGASRLRITVTASHSENQIAALCDAIAAIKDR